MRISSMACSAHGEPSITHVPRSTSDSIAATCEMSFQEVGCVLTNAAMAIKNATASTTPMSKRITHFRVVSFS
ncbi:MAG: hypothetical protein WCF84_01595 [Anaerolineae bacterium]